MTANPTMIIDAYSQTLRHGDIDPTIMCHVAGSKFIQGNGEISGPCPLNFMLLEPFDTDTHFTQYNCQQAVRCIKSDAANYDLSFRFCAVDLDFGRHGRRPNRIDFSDLCRTCHVMGVEDGLTPSILYETRGGARAIWLIEEITSAEEFESHYASLLGKLDAIFCRCEHGYRVDVAVRDWTRLYRCPLVKRDGEKEYMRLVQLFHQDVLDLRTFRPKKKPERKPVVGNLPFDANNRYLLRLLKSEMVLGQRNATLNSGLFHIYQHYNDEACAKWVDAFREQALSQGLTEKEFDDTNKSAQKGAKTNGQRN